MDQPKGDQVIWQKEGHGQEFKDYYPGSLIVVNYNMGGIGNTKIGRNKTANLLKLMGEKMHQIHVGIFPEVENFRNDDLFPRSSYHHYYIGRGGRRVGGVSIFLRKDIHKFDDYEALTSQSLSTITLNVRFRGLKMRVVAMYLPLVNVNHHNAKTVIIDALVKNSGIPTIIAGDLNVSAKLLILRTVDNYLFIGSSEPSNFSTSWTLSLLTITW